MSDSEYLSETLTPQRYPPLYEPHLSQREIDEGISSGLLLKGKLRINQKNAEDCYVTCSEEVLHDISVPTLKARNRALDGDIVAVQLLPKNCWPILVNDARRAGVDIPEDHRHVLHETLSQSSIGSPSKLKRSISLRQTNTRGSSTQARSRYSSSTNASPRHDSTSPQHYQHNSNMRFSPSQRPKDFSPNGESDADSLSHALHKMSVSDSRLHVPSSPRATAVCQENSPDYADKEPASASLSTNTRSDDIPYQFLRPTGKVVGIISRDKDRIFVGKLESLKGKYARFIPRDSRVPQMLIPERDLPEDFRKNFQEYSKCCFSVKLVCWIESARTGVGKLVANIGVAGMLDVETKSIISQHNIPTQEFSREALLCLPSLFANDKWEIPEKELASRRDLRRLRTFSIDPPTASYFLSEGTALDKEAFQRATTTYMVHGVYPMLPRLLCEQLCSLVEDEDRLAVSIIWTLDKQGNKFDQWIGRTIIRSCAKLAYEHAEAIIANPNTELTVNELPKISSPHRIDDVKQDVLNLHRIAQAIRKNRVEGGSVSLDKGKIHIKIDEETLQPLEILPFVASCPSPETSYCMKDSNRLVEDFMLLANITVAEFISNRFPKCALLRRHPPPLLSRLADTREDLLPHGVIIEESNEKELSQSLRHAIENFRASGANDGQLAQYFCTGDETLTRDDWCHFALNVPMYTHFTSPIRRYADVIVHRLLMAALYDQATEYTVEHVKTIVDHCNQRKLAAKRAQEDSSVMFVSAYVMEHGPLETVAVVTNVFSCAVKVILPEFAIEEQIFVDRIGLDDFNYDEASKQLVLCWPMQQGAPARKQTLEVFSDLRVKLSAKFKNQRFSYKVEALRPN
eukprot:gene9789-1986_t